GGADGRGRGGPGGGGQPAPKGRGPGETTPGADTRAGGAAAPPPLRRRALFVAHRCVLMVVIADMPDRRRSARRWSGSRTIFTGIRCAILVKLPLALSGGRRLNSAPVPGEMVSTRPVHTASGTPSTRTSARSPRR